MQDRRRPRITSAIAVALAAMALTVMANTSKPDPEMKMVLDALASLGGKPTETLSPAEARKQPTPADAVKKVLQQQGKSTAPEPVERSQMHEWPRAVYIRAETTGHRQVLVYPVASADMNTESYRENANAKPLSKPMMQWFAKHYLGENAAKGNAEINLATRRDLKGLPTTTIITADIDPLRTEGQMLAKALTDAGVQVTSRNFEGSAHEFFGMGAVVPDAREAVAFAAAELKKAFAVKRGSS